MCEFGFVIGSMMGQLGSHTLNILNARRAMFKEYLPVETEDRMACINVLVALSSCGGNHADAGQVSQMLQLLKSEGTFVEEIAAPECDKMLRNFVDKGLVRQSTHPVKLTHGYALTDDLLSRIDNATFEC